MSHLLRIISAGSVATLMGMSMLSGASGAEDPPKMDHSKMDHAKPTDASTAPSTAAFTAANEAMHADMNIPYSGNADIDFANGMIPHHQGAVAMAKIVLQFGKDPELKKLAEGIIKAQDEEIAFMTAWLKANGKQ